MKEQLVKLLNAKPFEGFVVEVAEDCEYSIPTRDHVRAGTNVLVVEDDSGYMDLIPYRHIHRIRHHSNVDLD
jgi:hypothetical protein